MFNPLRSPFAKLQFVMTTEMPVMVPKNSALQVRADLKWITPEARHEVNEWLMARFGSKPNIITAQVFGRQCVYCNPYWESVVAKAALVSDGMV